MYRFSFGLNLQLCVFGVPLFVIRPLIQFVRSVIKFSVKSQVAFCHLVPNISTHWLLHKKS
jgi:hypothetical protein